jgi:hypothetical protein
MTTLGVIAWERVSTNQLKGHNRRDQTYSILMVFPKGIRGDDVVAVESSCLLIKIVRKRFPLG